ncbi:MAG TPA: diacylglycerol kinase family protein [Gemmatimonadales bacterium]|jgi:diacylglycerol kinase family enzyme|nr:diacylglycerol kinase family protein [Gemmatimonadales bacterium]
MRITVLLNAASGTGAAPAARAEIERLLAEAGHQARVELAAGERLPELARKAVEGGADAVLAGGGDGTISGVAGALAGTEVPLGVLPLGTLNHFARDLGIPLGLPDAIGVILAGVVTPIDVGEVNGHVFLNNSSIGVYPRVLRLRERYRQRGRSKWIAAFWAILAVLRRHSFMGVRVEADGETIVRRTPFVFVGNNAYRMEGLSAGSRDSLTDGRLVIYMMNAGGRRSLLWLAWNVLIGRTRQLTELEERSVLEAQIELRRGGIQLALDGEVIEERGPLAYRVRPGALRVFTPA